MLLPLDFSRLRLAPSSLLLLIASTTTPTPAFELPWPNFRNEVRRAANTGILTAQEQPVGVRKMTDDEDEMFFPEYWSFEAESTGGPGPGLDKREPIHRLLDLGKEEDDDTHSRSNTTMFQSLQAPLALHTIERLNPILARSPQAIFSLDKRAFQCPGGTSACTSISRPNSCCPVDQTCQLISDSGLGDVGCCTQGQSCSQQVSGCQQGYASCPGSSGGGCCVPGYACVGVGCAISSTAIFTIQHTVTASPPSTSTPSSSTPALEPLPLTPQSTEPIYSTSVITKITSMISTATASTSPQSTTSSSTSSPSSPPPSSTPSSSLSSTPAPLPPVRPTSGSATTTATAPPTTIVPTICPTGFYQCSAYLHPGCCRIGRSCDLTSCPADPSSTALASNGVTVAIPNASSSQALGASGCALGWFSCAQGQGGGCCPSGYACGTSCTATGVVVEGGATGTAQVAKNNRGERVISGGYGMGFGFGMLFWGVWALF